MTGPLSAYLDRICRRADERWRQGFPRTEEPLMNQVLGELHRSCPGNVQLIGLHRKGTNNADLHGSDFAVSVTKGNFRKIAVFQTKRSIDDVVILEYAQLQDAMTSGLPTQSLFILAADPRAYDFRITEVAPLYKAWPGGQITQQHRPVRWESLRSWAWRWLQCAVGGLDIGEFQQANAALSVDAILQERRWWPSVFLKIVLPDEDFDMS